MLVRALGWGRAAAIAGALVAACPAAASADDGAGCSLVSSSKPVCTVLRPPRSAHAVRSPAPLGEECVILVGGLRSPTSYDDGFFDPLIGALARERPYRFIRFGLEPATRGHAYDTVGSISRNGEALRALIHEMSSECRAVHLVSHSMGGAVADRALSKGDPAEDGVVTYVALSGPHNGAFGARAVRWGVELDETFARRVHAATAALSIHDPTSDAVRDLVRTHAPRPLRAVEQVRMRLVTDEIVLHSDSADRRVDAREYLGAIDAIEGHGTIVRDRQVGEVVTGTIRAHRVPPEARSPVELRVVVDEARRWELLYGGVQAAIGGALVIGALATRSAVALGAAGAPLP